MDWEKKKASSMSREELEAHRQKLVENVASLKSQRDKLLVRKNTENKIWRFNSDISQLNWRLKYLSNINLE